eukprot:293111-Rhodomonas_salina.1
MVDSGVSTLSTHLLRLSGSITGIGFVQSCRTDEDDSETTSVLDVWGPCLLSSGLAREAITPNAVA